VEQAFFNNAVKVVRMYSDKILCADPRRDIASSACCVNGGVNSTRTAVRSEKFWGERMAYATAASRCSQLCRFPSVYNDCRLNGKDKNECKNYGHYWTNAPCALKVKIDPESGNVGIVYDAGVLVDKAKMALHVQESTLTYFRVHWNAQYPTPSNECGGSNLCVIYEEKCLCEVQVNESLVFTSMPTSSEVIERLHIGSLDPKTIGYELSTTQGGVTVHYKDENEKYTTSSIFQLTDAFGITHYLKNLVSVVNVVGVSPATSFRNPPHFLSLVDEEPRDAIFETDAALDQYFRHKNTAPFLSIRLIKRFGFSNPSPRYINVVADAFVTGLYMWNSQSGSLSKSFGSGKYGDLGATIAAILLDREARNILLDTDPAHGSFHEPLRKVIGFMRAMEAKADTDRPFVEFSNIENDIGQMAYAVGTVFSFFLNDYHPSGPLTLASLTAPEAQLLTCPNIIGTSNGLISMIKYGFHSAWDGFFNSRGGSSIRDPGDFFYSLGRLTYSPSVATTSDAIVDELSTLLCSGRLSLESKQIIKQTYDNEKNKTAALMMAQQLIVTTPEFHSTGLVKNTGKARAKIPLPQPSQEPYKGIVNIHLSGGYDSWNLLVPQCEPQSSQYAKKRQQLALSNDFNESLPIAIDPLNDQPPQPCQKFAIHHKLSSLQDGFNNKDTIFLLIQVFLMPQSIRQTTRA